MVDLFEQLAADFSLEPSDWLEHDNEYPDTLKVGHNLINSTNRGFNLPGFDAGHFCIVDYHTPKAIAGPQTYLYFRPDTGGLISNPWAAETNPGFQVSMVTLPYFNSRTESRIREVDPTGLEATKIFDEEGDVGEAFLLIETGNIIQVALLEKLTGELPEMTYIGEIVLDNEKSMLQIFSEFAEKLKAAPSLSQQNDDLLAYHFNNFLWALLYDRMYEFGMGTEDEISDDIGAAVRGF